jgi:hypothetical protein
MAPVLASADVGRGNRTERKGEAATPNRALAALIGGVVAAVLVIGASGGDVGKTARSDGLIYRYIAAHIDQDPEDVDPVVAERGTSLRYGRIGLPALIWVASAGQPEAMPYAQAALMILAAAATSAATVILLPRAGPLTPLLPFVAPGLTLSVVGGYAEAMAVALGLWCLVFLRADRWLPALGTLSMAILTRENAAAVLVGGFLWLILQRRVRSAGLLALSLVPVGVWYGYVSVRFGHIPVLDPYLRIRTETIDTPFLAVLRSIADPISTRSLLMALIHIGLAVVAFAMWRRSLFGAVAAAAGLQVLSAGRFSWAFIGEASRVFVLLELFVVLTLVERRMRPAPEPAPVLEAA